MPADTGVHATELEQDLERAAAAYQRYHGRPQTILKLDHMADARREAQRLMDESSERIGGKSPRAAE